MHRKKEDTQEEPATALQKRNNRCICLMKENTTYLFNKSAVCFSRHLGTARWMGIQMNATEMKCMVGLIYRWNSARILSLFSHLSDQYLLLPVEQINKFKMIVLSTKSCSVREITTLEQENNAMKFCLHYCLRWNIPLMFHFSSCVTRHTMSCSNLPSDSVFERSPSSLIVYYLALILHQVLWSVYILCVRELCFWLAITHSIR